MDLSAALGQATDNSIGDSVGSNVLGIIVYFGLYIHNTGPRCIQLASSSGSVTLAHGYFTVDVFDV